MFRLLIMCLLGLSGIFFERLGARGSPEMMSNTKEETEEGMSLKLKRYLNHGVSSPCPLPPASGVSTHHVPQTYHSPLIIPTYHQTPKVVTAEYQKPVIPKMIYQTIQRPAVHHEAYNVEAKHQVQYIQQPIYAPTVKEQPISYVKPIQHIQPVQLIHPVKTPLVKEIPCEDSKHLGMFVVPSKPMVKPTIQQSYYPKQVFQQISYLPPKHLTQPKPIYFTPAHTNKHASPGIVYKTAQQPIVKVSAAASPHADCEKMHQPRISYVNIHQPIVQNAHQPMLQYAPNYHKPMLHYVQKIHQPVHQSMVNYVQKIHQPVFHVAPKIHQPILHQPIVHIPVKIHQPAVQNAVVHYAQHHVSSVTPRVDYAVGGHYQSRIVNFNQPCHK